MNPTAGFEKQFLGSNLQFYPDQTINACHANLENKL